MKRSHFGRSIKATKFALSCRRMLQSGSGVHELLRKLEGERLRVLERYRAALSLSGDAVQGARVFKDKL